jgi:hypothetical protein
LIERYPTFAFTCFDAGLGLVRDLVRESHVGNPELFLERVGLVDLETVRQPGRPSEVGDRVLLFRSTLNPDVTTMVSNFQDGWMTLGFRISRDGRCRVHQFKTSTRAAEWKMHSIRVIDHGEERRVVMSLQDPRWKFFEKGTPLREEETSRYSDRRVSKRLTHDYVVGLARRLGFPIDDDAYWTSNEPATYFLQKHGWTPGPDVYERIEY